MSLLNLGLTTLNQIPSQAITGLLTNQLEMTGGVIRWAAGSEKGGQIFMHLLPAGNSLLNMVPGLDCIPGIIANFQLYGLSDQIHGLSGQMSTLQQITQFNAYHLNDLTHHIGAVSEHVSSLSQATEQILTMATGAAVLSGLSLAVSSIGFRAVNEKLKRIDSKLDAIRKDVQFIKQFLELTERGKLRAALADLIKIEKINTSDNRMAIIHNARKTLAEINQKYQDLLISSSSINQSMAYEEYYALTALMQVRCSAELGEFELAHQEIEEMHTFWQTQARRIIKDLLIGQYPERFLASDFAQDVPTSALISWLDFAYEQKKGLAWIDDMRMKINKPWYDKNITTEIKDILFSKDSILYKQITVLNKPIGLGLEKEKKYVIPTLQKLMMRNNVFEGYRSQYTFFQEKKLKPSTFQMQLAELPEDVIVNGYYLLQPNSGLLRISRKSSQD